MAEFQRHRPLHQLRVCCVRCAFSTCRALLSTNCWRLFQAAHVHMPSTESIWTHSRTHKFKQRTRPQWQRWRTMWTVCSLPHAFTFQSFRSTYTTFAHTATRPYLFTALPRMLRMSKETKRYMSQRHVARWATPKPNKTLDTHIKCNHLWTFRIVPMTTTTTTVCHSQSLTVITLSPIFCLFF